MPQESVNQNFSELFGEALALQQEKKWDESISAYKRILDQGRENADQSKAKLTDQQASTLYHNMSVASFSNGDFLKAYAWSKKALHLNPANTQARDSLQGLTQKIEIPNIPHQISNLDNLKKVVSTLPTDIWIVLAVVLVLTTFWFSLKRFVIVKKNKLNDIFKNPSNWPVYILSTFSLFVISIAILAFMQSQKQMAIVIVEKAAVQTVPGENKPVIFEAYAGIELEVLSGDKNYFQVRYPGAFTGWVKSDQIELLSLTFRQ
jgi:tetratricopeptide (TPR) repeat protein